MSETRESADDELLTPAKAARLAGVHPSTIARWVAARRITALTTPGGHKRIPRREIERLWKEAL